MNCCPPDIIADLVEVIRKETDRPIIVYPNSGEHWNAPEQRFESSPSALSGPEELAKLSLQYVQRGANIVGGCCSIGPSYIEKLRYYLDEYISKGLTPTTLRSNSTGDEV